MIVLVITLNVDHREVTSALMIAIFTTLRASESLVAGIEMSPCLSHVFFRDCCDDPDVEVVHPMAGMSNQSLDRPCGSYAGVGQGNPARMQHKTVLTQDHFYSTFFST